MGTWSCHLPKVPLWGPLGGFVSFLQEEMGPALARPWDLCDTGCERLFETSAHTSLSNAVRRPGSKAEVAHLAAGLRTAGHEGKDTSSGHSDSENLKPAPHHHQPPTPLPRLCRRGRCGRETRKVSSQALAASHGHHVGCTLRAKSKGRVGGRPGPAGAPVDWVRDGFLGSFWKDSVRGSP